MDERATISLCVNGDQAKDVLDELDKKVVKLKKELDALEEAGDLKGAERVKRALESAKDEKFVQAKNVVMLESVIEGLIDSGTSKETLQNAENWWKEQLAKTPPGSDDWVYNSDQLNTVQMLLRTLKEAEEKSSYLLHENKRADGKVEYPGEYRINELKKNEEDYEQGLKSYREYRERMLEINFEYNRLMSTHVDTTDKEKYAVAAHKAQAALNQFKNTTDRKESRERQRELQLEIEEEYRLKQLALVKVHESGKLSELAYREEKFQNEMEYLEKLKTVYRADSYDRHEIERRIQRTEFAYQEQKAKEFIDMKQRIERTYFMDYGAMSKEKHEEEYQYAVEVLNKIIEQRKNLLLLKKEEGELTEEQYQKELAKLDSMFSTASKGISLHYGQEKEVGEELYRTWNGWVDEMGHRHEGLGEKIQKGVGEVASSISAITQSLTESYVRELEIRETKINRFYDEALKYAQGNSYKEAKIEKKREQALLKAKQESQRRQMAAQVLSAIATTAQNAVSAYGAGLQIGGLAGLIMAPIAAAAAIAAGAIQISTIKKQQEQLSSQFSEGGFTKKGDKNEVAGIVHAGEWVAPKRMVEDSETGPIISNLEKIRRGNRTFNPMLLPKVPNINGRVESIESSTRIREYQIIEKFKKEVSSILPDQKPNESLEPDRRDEVLETMVSELREIFSQPIRAFVPMTGDEGLVDSIQRYQRLMNNPTPKGKRQKILFTR